MKKLETVKWGFIGCGDVTELKSGPAFNKIENSVVVGAFRRDQQKLKDYAFRHKIPKIYNSIEELLADDDINAVYIATPPNTHKKYTIMASNAKKAIYVEKPMAFNYKDGLEMMKVCEQNNTSLFVAHYRRYLSDFKLVKELLDAGEIGTPRSVELRVFISPSTAGFSDNKSWRVNPEISGGGYFHDLAPHQLDILNMYFGKAEEIVSITANHAKMYEPEDFVTALIKYEKGVVLNAVWCFNTGQESENDCIQIFGSKGTISFSTWGNSPTLLVNKKGRKEFKRVGLENVQLPTIESIVTDLRGGKKSKVRANVAIETVRIMDEILS